MELEVEQILEDAHAIGKHVLATLVVDPEAFDPEMSGSYETDSGICCPLCEDTVSMCVRAYCIRHDMMCSCFYCPDCWLIFEFIEIGVLDEGSNFIPNNK